MAWFKVDDRLHHHRKARRVRRSHQSKSRDAAPFGLWVLAGSWCGTSGTNGFVPREILLDFDDDADELAERLVEAGMWIADTVDGDEGFWFHDYEHMNPTESGAISGRYGNHVRWHQSRGIVEPGCEWCEDDDSPESQADSTEAIGGESGAISGGVALPVPSRTRPVPVPVPNKTSNLDPPEFIAFWATYPKRVGKGAARKAWKSAVKKADPDLIIAGAGEYADWCERDRTETRFIKNPATWLNAECWADERVARRADEPATRLDGFRDVDAQLAAREADQHMQPHQRQIGAAR